MMENSDHATEGDPLKSEDGVEAGRTVSPAEIKKGCKGLGFGKLAHWRTAVFFFSLFLCLTVVFAFSFIIPCPVRPQYLISWSRTFNESASYDFLAVQDASKDKVMDVLFILKSEEGSLNHSCVGEGFQSPCLFVLAVDGTDGESLWERPLEPEFHWAQCGFEKDSGRGWDCLVAHSNQITALDKYKGEVQWQRLQPTGLQSNVPVLSLPDLDGDKVGDVALVAHDSTKTEVTFLSGKEGNQIGSPVALDATETDSHLLYRTKDGSYYVLLNKDTGLFGIALWRLVAEADIQASLTKDKRWESKASETTGLVPIFMSDQMRKVLKTSEKDRSNLLLVTGREVVIIDGNLQILWSYNATLVLSTPSFGHFNKDNIQDVVIEEDVGNHTKKVTILDGKSGLVLWDVSLQASPNSPRPSSIHTTNYFSVFMFWGLMLTETNSSVTRRAYMLHPRYAEVLLESTNVVEHIIAFRATLLEHGRHAAYFTLTGPGTEGAEGTVTLSKRKLKQDVPDSRVIRIGSGEDTETNEDIKEAFNRLRFSDE